MNDIFTRELFLGILVSGFLLGIAPYCFPRNGHPKGLPMTVEELLARYVWGAGSLLVGYTVWLILSGQGWLVLGLLIITIGGGSVVVFRYTSDYYRASKAKDDMFKASDD